MLLVDELLAQFLFLPSCLVALVQVPAQVLNLLLLFPEDLAQFLSRVPHILQHVAKFLH